MGEISMIPQQSHIGIWGFGISGKSIARFLLDQGYVLSILDRKKSVIENTEFESKVQFFSEEEKEIFFQSVDLIIPSPGVDIRSYEKKFTFVAEVDLFYHWWKKRFPSATIIAITGTVGKTSTTHLLSQMLQSAGYVVATGGNIGVGLMDLLNVKNPDYAVIELSSFQLEYASSFAPDVAVWTNLYPKHLDRHETYDQYFRAKYQIMARQVKDQISIVPYYLKDSIEREESSLRGIRYYFSDSPDDRASTYIVHQSNLIKITKDRSVLLALAHEVPPVSFIQNWLLIFAVADMLSIPKEKVLNAPYDLPEHRGECLGKVGGITFYDDSKSTILEATYKMVDRHQDKPIILLLGGVSEGVDRREGVGQLSGKVKKIHAFGAEAFLLSQAAISAGILANPHDTLEAAFRAACVDAKEGDVVLLSPGGPSFDLFTNYHQRGERFKELVIDFGRTARLG
jgi:UDP-N-acetylmuramoylalanine--D-glutamate ligase